MAVQRIGAVVSFARSAIACRTSGMWRAIRAHIEGRNAVSLERERRTTLLAVPSALPPDAEVYDLRADGSLLQLRVPLVTRIDARLGGNPEKDSPRTVLPAVGPPGQDSRGELASIPSAAEE
jgi:hypothetical protein